MAPSAVAMILPVIVLSVMTLVSAVVAVNVVRRTGRLLSFRFLLLANYSVVVLVSGIAHILNTDASRGYFDAASELDLGQFEAATLLAALGMGAICFGLLSGSRRVEQEEEVGAGSKTLSRFDRVALPTFALVLLTVSVWAFTRLQGFVSTLDSTRVISISGGLARYSFLSSWFVWAVSFIVIWLVFRPTRPPGYLTVAYLIAGVALIAASLQWNGGRSVVLVMTLPLVMVVIGHVHQTRWLTVVGGFLLVSFYLLRGLATTRAREEGMRSGSSSLTDWLDWQSGRFSMLGFSIRYTDQNGFLLGETIANGAFRFLDGFARLSGSALPEPGLRSSVEVAAETLLNSSSRLYVVPGLSAELYLNFGIIGFLLGHFALGRLCGATDRRFESSTTPVTKLFWAYLGTLLVFRTIQADSGSLVGLLVFTGAPVIVAAVASGRSAQRTKGESAPRSSARSSAGLGQSRSRQPSVVLAFGSNR